MSRSAFSGSLSLPASSRSSSPIYPIAFRTTVICAGADFWTAYLLICDESGNGELFWGQIRGAWASEEEATEMMTELEHQIDDLGIIPFDITLAQVPEDEFFAPTRDWYTEIDAHFIGDASVWILYPDTELLIACLRGDPAPDRFRSIYTEIYAMECIARAGGHPNIVDYYGCQPRFGKIVGICVRKHNCSLLFLVEGNMPRDVGVCPPYRPEVIFADIQSAVNFLHSLGFVHRRIEPRHIYVDENGRGILTSFRKCIPIGSTPYFPGEWRPPHSDPAGLIADDLHDLDMLRRYMLGEVDFWRSTDGDYSDGEYGDDSGEEYGDDLDEQ